VLTWQEQVKMCKTTKPHFFLVLREQEHLVVILGWAGLFWVPFLVWGLWRLQVATRKDPKRLENKGVF